MIKYLAVCAIVLSLVGCSTKSSPYLDADRLKDTNGLFDDQSSKVVIEYFREDNGKLYCVPNMTDSELLEFKMRIPAMLIENITVAMQSNEVGRMLYEQPVRNGLRVALMREYPCRTYEEVETVSNALPIPENGESTYKTICMACHSEGIAGAPKTGDIVAWMPRAARGKEILYKHAIEGYVGKSGVMPAKGGRTDLSDNLVKSAVDYMLQSDDVLYNIAAN